MQVSSEKHGHSDDVNVLSEEAKESDSHSIESHVVEETLPTAIPDPEADANRLHLTQTEDDEYPSTKKLIFILLSLYISVFLVALDRTIIGTAIPSITDDFNSFQDIGWYGSAYLLTFCAFQLTTGRIYTFYPAKWVFLIGIIIFEIGSAICGAAPNSPALIWGRAIAGLGSAGIFNGAIIIMLGAVPLDKRPMFQGLFAAIFGVASVAGPLLGGVFTTKVTWRWCFYINLPFGLVAIVMILFLLEPKAPVNPGAGFWHQLKMLDPLGSLCLVPALVCLLLALQWGGTTYAWSDGRIVALLVLAGVLGVCFALVEWRLPETATVPGRFLKNRTIVGGFVFVFCLASVQMILVYYLPVWFQAIKGSSAVQSGIQNLPLLLSLVVISMITGAAVSRFGYYVPPMYLSSVLMTVGCGMVSTFELDTAHPAWIGYQCLVGLGMGMGMQQPSIAVQTVLPRRDASAGITLMFFGQTLGGAVFISVSQNILSNRLVGAVAGRVPGLDAATLVRVGATDLRRVVPPAYATFVLEAYNSALRDVWYAATAASAATIVGCALMEWRNVKKEAARREQEKKERKLQQQQQEEAQGAEKQSAPGTETV